MAAEAETREQRRDDDKQWLEVWKYYGSIGGGDKDTMVKIDTLLLTISTAALSAYATGKLTNSPADMIVLGLSGLLSLLAAFVAVLYGAYAAWNWAIADQIASDRRWTKQEPSYVPPAVKSQLETWGSPLHLAKPWQGRVAPVFWIFCIISLVVAVTAVVLIVIRLRCGR